MHEEWDNNRAKQIIINLSPKDVREFIESSTDEMFNFVHHKS